MPNNIVGEEDGEWCFDDNDVWVTTNAPETAAIAWIFYQANIIQIGNGGVRKGLLSSLREIASAVLTRRVLLHQNG